MTATPTFDTLPINILFPHPANVRRELTDIEELADSIRSEGLHQPLVVTPRIDGDDGYTVIMGHRRLAASRAAGKIHAPCIIRTDLDSEEKVLSAMLAENCARNDLTVSEEGDAFQRLLELDLSAATIGKRAGRSRKQVTDRVTVAGQSETVRTAVDDKQLTLSDALALAELADDHELYARIEATIGTPRFNYELQSAIVYRKHIQQAATLRADAIKAGHAELDEDALPEGSRVEKLYTFGDDPEPAENFRFEVVNSNPELYPPKMVWHQIVASNVDAGAPETSGSAASSAPLSAEQRAERDAAVARAEKARAEDQERKTAANKRRPFLRQLWDVDFAVEDAVWAPSVAKLLRMAVAEHGYDWEDLTTLDYFLTHGDTDERGGLADDDPRLDPTDWSTLRLQFAVWWCRWAAMCEREVSNYQPNFWEPDTAHYLETLRDVLDYELTDIEDALLDTYHANADADGDD